LACAAGFVVVLDVELVEELPELPQPAAATAAASVINRTFLMGGAPSSRFINASG
jgi:hypothetical protein